MRLFSANVGGSSGGGGGGITSINADATAAQLLTVGTSGTDFAIADNGTGTHAFNLPDASATARGVVTTGAQTLAGAKTFSSAPILSSLTATRLVYTDGSKVLTSNAALTASRILVSDSGGLPVASSQASSELGTYVVGPGTVIDNDLPVFSGTTGFLVKKFSGYGLYTAFGAGNPYLNITSGYGVNINSTTMWELTSSGIMYLSKSSGANFLWATDQAGSIGGSAGNRPLNGFFAGDLVVGTGANATGATSRFLYITSSAGTPAGTPSGYTGRVAIQYDTTNNFLYVYNGAWKASPLFV